jgi:hypothetical protein
MKDQVSTVTSLPAGKNEMAPHIRFCLRLSLACANPDNRTFTTTVVVDRFVETNLEKTNPIQNQEAPAPLCGPHD